jgi:hypothetical protein
MLMISQEQMDAIAAAMDEQRWQAALGRSREFGIMQALLAQAPEETLKSFAHGLGVDETEDLLRLFHLVARYGIRFFRLPWAEPFFYRLPLDYPHETLLHLIAQSQEYEREQDGH